MIHICCENGSISAVFAAYFFLRTIPLCCSLNLVVFRGYLKLFTAVRDAFYGAEYIDNLRKYHNKFLIAIDGSDTALPNLPSLIEKFGGTGSKSSSPTARMSIAYDVLNDFIIDAAFTPLNVSEREHAKNHIESVGKIIDLKNSIFIMDRGYASQELIEIFSEKSYYLFRLRTKFNNDIDALPIGSHVISMYDNLKVRIVKFALPSGEIETLITNLFDLDESEFKELYFKRWRIEVEYDVVKNKLELPCFGGFSENIIMKLSIILDTFSSNKIQAARFKPW